MFNRPGNVLLSHALRQSTIGAGALNVRVRNGIVCNLSAKTTRSTKHEINTKQYFINYSILVLLAFTSLFLVHRKSSRSSY